VQGERSCKESRGAGRCARVTHLTVLTLSSSVASSSAMTMQFLWVWSTEHVHMCVTPSSITLYRAYLMWCEWAGCDVSGVVRL
jgi:hypothetical protein